MFQNAVIDIAIGLVLMYLVLSLACTVINEFIATKLQLRAATLQSGLAQLLDDPTVRAAFYDHGLIDGTLKAVTRGGEALSASLSPGMKGMTTTVVAPVDAPKAVEAAHDAAQTTAAAAADKDRVAKAAAEAAKIASPADTEAAAQAAKAATSEAKAAADKAQTAARISADVKAASAPVAGSTAAAASGTATAPPTGAKEHPSYLAAETFAKALIGSLDTKNPIPGIDEIKAAVLKLPDSNMKDSLLAGLTNAGTDLNTFRAEVATWFDNSMDRLSGAYKRQLKWISLIIGLAVAIIVNADSFDVGYALWSDNTLRAQMVQAASTTAAQGIQNKQPTDVAKAFQDANATLRPLPIGWPLRTWPGKADAAKPTDAGAGSWFWFGLAKLLGWLVTGLALSLGAPFWFDLLDKLIKIRGAGDKPKRADAT